MVLANTVCTMQVDKNRPNRTFYSIFPWNFFIIIFH